MISPSTERLDRTSKLAIYARDGVSHAWLINPASQTLEVLALAGGRWPLLSSHAGGSVVRAEPFDAIELELSALWTSGPTSEAGTTPPAPQA